MKTTQNSELKTQNSELRTQKHTSVIPADHG